MERMRLIRIAVLVAAVSMLALAPAGPAAANPEGSLSWGVHISLAPTFFDPAETPGLITPFMVLYALHDALVKPMLNQASYLGLAKVANSIIPSQMDYFWQPPAPRYDPAQAKKLLAEAGYANGFDAGDLGGDMIYGSAIGEPSANYLNAVGIRTRLRLMERAAYYNDYGEKKLRGVLYTGSAAFGNAATRLETYVVGGGRYVYGSAPDIDGLFAEQVNESNPRMRQQVLHRIQQMMVERVMFIPVMETAFLNGVGPAVDNHGLNVIPGFAYSAPYEDLRLKKKQ
jgi:peptide/nickel transport system substrate-binding protein